VAHDLNNLLTPVIGYSEMQANTSSRGMIRVNLSRPFRKRASERGTSSVNSSPSVGARP